MKKPSKDSSTLELNLSCSSSIPSLSTLTEPAGMQPSHFKRPTPSELIATEDELKRLWEAGEIPSLLHLAGSVDGSYEEWLCNYFEKNVKPTDWVLASHRAHYHYQLHGETNLIEKVLAGKSMFCYGPRFIQSAIVAGTCSIAVGLGLSIKNRGGGEYVHCFIGDGASEHGHALEAIGYVAAKGLPVRFIIESNDSSCGVKIHQRRGSEWEWTWPGCVTKIPYQPKYPHGGSGVRPNLKWKSKV